MKRQLKTYDVTIGVTTRTEDNSAFGTVTVQATDALAAANKVNANLGKLQYVAEVTLEPVAVQEPWPVLEGLANQPFPFWPGNGIGDPAPAITAEIVEDAA